MDEYAELSNEKIESVKRVIECFSTGMESADILIYEMLRLFYLEEEARKCKEIIDLPKLSRAFEGHPGAPFDSISS